MLSVRILIAFFLFSFFTIVIKGQNYIVDRLNCMEDVSCSIPGGAFYAFPNISKTGLSSSDFAEIALNKYGVALLSGTAFGEYGDLYEPLQFYILVCPLS